MANERKVITPDSSVSLDIYRWQGMLSLICVDRLIRRLVMSKVGYLSLVTAGTAFVLMSLTLVSSGGARA